MQILFKKMVLVFAVCCSVVTPALAGLKTDTGAPKNEQPFIITTSDGTPQVNIQTPNSSGVSMNQFSEFDVDAKGVVINNSRKDVVSQSSGWVSGNPYLLTGEAGVIVNQVNSNAPSSLGGVIEITGRKADFIVANPSGISINGATILNAGTATLTTGHVMRGSSGSVTGFDVQNGGITVEGKGLNARGSDYTQLLSRAVELNAKVYAKRLDVIAGSNRVSSDGLSINKTDSSSTSPAVAIDTKVLGGMYANRIRLIGTEQGVGINNAGEVVSTESDLVITADGVLTNKNLIQGKRLEIKAKGLTQTADARLVQTGIQGLDVHTEVLSNKGLIGTQVDASQSGGSGATTGGVTGGASSGSTTSGGSSSSGSVSTEVLSQGVVEVTELDNAKGASISSVGKLDVTADKFWKNEGEVWVNELNLTSKSGSNAGGVIQANRYRLKGGDVDNTKGVLSSSVEGDIDLTGTLDNTEGRVASSKGLSIKVGQSINNHKGKITSVKDLSVSSVLGVDNREGVIESSDQLNIAVAQKLDNYGLIKSGNRLSVKAKEVHNHQGGMTYSEKSSYFTVEKRLVNDGELLSGKAGEPSVLEVKSKGDIVNRGLMQSHILNIDAKGTLTNTKTLRANQDMLLTGGQLTNQGVIYTTGSGTLKADMGGISNSGKFLSSGVLDVAGGLSGITNRGSLVSMGKLLIGGVSLSNAVSGIILSKAVFDIEASGDVRNKGHIESLGRGLNKITANNVINESTARGGYTVFNKVLDFYLKIKDKQGNKRHGSKQRKWWYLHHDGFLEVIRAKIKNTESGQISALGDLEITARDRVENKSSYIGSGGHITIAANYVKNISDENTAKQSRYEIGIRHKRTKCGFGWRRCDTYTDENQYPSNYKEPSQFWSALDANRWLFTTGALQGVTISDGFGKRAEHTTQVVGQLSNITGGKVTLNIKDSGVNTGVIHATSGSVEVNGIDKSNMRNKTESTVGKSSKNSSNQSFGNGGQGMDTPKGSSVISVMDYLGSSGKDFSKIFDLDVPNTSSKFANEIFRPTKRPTDVIPPINRIFNTERPDLEDYAMHLKARGVEYYLHPLQEMRVIRQALLANTGRTVISSQWSSEKEQLNGLLANARAYAKSTGIKLGEPLNSAQIANITQPMVWYQATKIKGKTSLLPYVYLPQSLIAKLSKTRAGTMDATKNVVVNIKGDFKNTGSINGDNAVGIKARNILNEERTFSTIKTDMGQTTFSLGGGQITGGNVQLDAVKDITMKGGDIKSDDKLIVKAGNNVNIEALKLGSDLHIKSAGYTYDETNIKHDVAHLTSGAGGLLIKAGNDLRAEGTNIHSDGTVGLVAGGNIDLASVKDERYRFEEIRQKKSFGRKKTTATTTYDATHKGVSIKGGKNLILKSGNHMKLESVNADIKGSGRIDAGGDLTITANVDEHMSRTEVKKSNVARKKNTDRGTVTQTGSNSRINAGGNLSFNAGGDMSVVGSDLSSGKNLVIGDMKIKRDADGNAIKAEGGGYVTESGKTVKNLTVTGLELKNKQWNKTTRSLRGPVKELAKVATAVISFIPMAQGLGINPEITLAESKETRTETTTYQQSDVTGQNVLGNVQGTALFEGANVKATADKEGKGGNIVVLAKDIRTDALETSQRDYTATSKETVKSLGIKAEKDQVRVGGVELTETKAVTDTRKTDWLGSSFNGKTVALKATHDIDVIASDITTVADLDIDAGNKVTIGGKNATEDTTHTLKEEQTTMSVGVKNAYVDTGLAAKNVQEATAALNDARKALKEAKAKVAQGKMAKSDLKYYEANIASATGNLTNANIQLASSGATAAASTATGGFYATGSAERTTNESKDTSHSEQWRGSNLKVGGHTRIKSGNAIDIIGSSIESESLDLDSTSVLITAGVERGNTTHSSKQMNQGVTVSTQSANSANVSLGESTTKGNSTSKTHVNSQINVGTLTSKSKNLKVAGARVMAKHLDIDTETFEVVSLQDESSNTSRTEGKSASFNLSSEATLKDNLTPGSIGANTSKTTGNRRWVGEQTQIIGTESAKIRAKHSTIKGAVVANATRQADGTLVDKGGLDFVTETLTTEDILDTDVSKTKGGGVNIALSKSGSSTLSGHNNGHNKEQINRATLGLGQITVGGKTQSKEQLASLGVNTDLSKAQELTKDMETGGLNASVTVDHRLATKEGRTSIKEDVLKTKMLADTANKVIQTEKLSLLDFNKELGKHNNTYEGIKKVIAENPAIADALSDPNRTPEEKQAIFQQVANGVQKGIGGKEVALNIVNTDESGHSGAPVKGHYGEDKQIYLNDKYSTGSDDALKTLGHELAHAQDDQKGEFKPGDKDQNKYANMYGKDVSNYTKFVTKNYHDKTVTKENNHVGSHSSALVDNNNKQFGGLDKSKGDDDRLYTDGKGVFTQFANDCPDCKAVDVNYGKGTRDLSEEAKKAQQALEQAKGVAERNKKRREDNRKAQAELIASLPPEERAKHIARLERIDRDIAKTFGSSSSNKSDVTDVDSDIPTTMGGTNPALVNLNKNVGKGMSTTADVVGTIHPIGTAGDIYEQGVGANGIKETVVLGVTGAVTKKVKVIDKLLGNQSKNAKTPNVPKADGTKKVYHYTDDAGAKAIEKTGVIKADSKGRVFVTKDKVPASEANNVLFMGRGGTKGTHRVEIELKDDVNLSRGTQPNELIHDGTIRNPRQGTFKVKENDF